MILTYRRPDPPDTHVLTMVNNVIEVLNYVIAAHPPPLNYVIADMIFSGKTGYVVNNSRRPFNDITCQVMSEIDRHSLATADGCGVVDLGPGSQGWIFLPGAKPVSGS
jgi:hypothetical protein